MDQEAAVLGDAGPGQPQREVVERPVKARRRPVDLLTVSLSSLFLQIFQTERGARESKARRRRDAPGRVSSQVRP